MRPWLASIPILLIAASATLANDEVVRMADGKTEVLQGTITSEDSQALTIKTAKGDVKVPIHEIESIKYQGQPAQLITIRSLIDQGRFEEAIDGYNKIYSTLDERKPLIQGSVAYGIFQASAQAALLDPSKADRAFKAYDLMTKRFPDSRYTIPMQEAMGRVYVASKDYKKGAELFAALGQSRWPGYDLKAKVLEGYAWLQEGSADRAIGLFDQVINASAKSDADKQQQTIAKVYKAEALARTADTSKLQEAEKLLREAMVALPVDPADRQTQIYRAAAHNALGDILRKQQRFKEAAIEGYMRTIVLYSQDGNETARALYQMSELCKAPLKRKDRADEMAARLRANYPTTEWAKLLPAEGS